MRITGAALHDVMDDIVIGGTDINYLLGTLDAVFGQLARVSFVCDSLYMHAVRY